MKTETKIWNYIKENPGCKGGAISTALGIVNASLHDHLAALQDEGRIYKEGNTNATRWFPCIGAV